MDNRMEKIIKLNQEARDALKSGVDQVADCVKVTLGPGGRNAILGRDYRTPLITNDGISIVKDIELADEVENLGADVIKDVSIKTNQEAGDGTTTAMVLAQALLGTVYPMLEKTAIPKADPMTLKRDIKAEADKVIVKLKEMAEPIKGREAEIASISAESDEIGKIIADVIKKVGKEGKVTVEDGDGFDIEVDVVKGMELPIGMSSSFMSNTERGTAEYSDVKVLITDNQIDNIDEILVIIQELVSQGRKSMILIAKGFNPDSLSQLVAIKQKGVFNTVCLKYNLNKEGFKDIAAVCNAEVVYKETDMKMTLDSLGELAKITADQEKSLLIGKSTGAVDKRVAEIKKEKTTTKYDKDTNEERIAKLVGGVGIIKVGASTETEREYLRLKIEDAVNATLAARDEGVVQGGGSALDIIAGLMPESILHDMLKAPLAQIEKNLGKPVIITPQILDPVKVTRTAIENACSVVGTLITTEVAIVTKNDKSDI